jgi:glycosyltransferase involved in cell wall biosynthesis
MYNPSLAVEVLKLLKSEYPDAELTMVGGKRGDDSIDETAQLASTLGVQRSVRFTGARPRSEVAEFLYQGDIFLNTTDVDNTPVSVMEAMAAGLCIVSTNVGGIPHLLEDEKDALLVPPRDPVAMAKAVERLIHDPALAGRLSQQARAKAERFDWEAVFPLWEKLVHSVARANQ